MDPQLTPSNAREAETAPPLSLFVLVGEVGGGEDQPRLARAPGELLDSGTESGEQQFDSDARLVVEEQSSGRDDLLAASHLVDGNPPTPPNEYPQRTPGCPQAAYDRQPRLDHNEGDRSRVDDCY